MNKATLRQNGPREPGSPAASIPDQRVYRLDSIDLLRGLAIVIMALDHVRDYLMAGTDFDPTSNPNVNPALFFTRWITHYCAPVFVGLAGVSAGLMTRRRSAHELGRLLLTRGLWLVLLEFSVVSMGWSFAPGGMEQFGGKYVVSLQVIWAIGASMVVLSAMQFLGHRTCLVVGGLILLSHNLLDPVWPQTELQGPSQPLWLAIHGQLSHEWGPFHLSFIYPLLPWTGLMLFGFGAAPHFDSEPARRNAVLFRTGIVLTVLFLVLRAVDFYGDPNPWEKGRGFMRTAMDFVNTTKYPPSLSYLLMTLGPAAILCAFADRARGFPRELLVTFGRAPFAFYISHIYLIHFLSMALGLVQGFEIRQFTTFFFFYPQGYGVGLPGVYLGWLIAVATLYPLCKWVAAIKARRRDWWLSYL